MVAIVSGMGAGLNLGSREILGQAGVAGAAVEGRNGQGVYVNVGKGLLVVQNQDDLLVSRGADSAVLRTYDARGNLRDVSDARAHIVMEYDLVGNRTRISTYVDYQGVTGEASNTSNRYFVYDKMNRQIVVDGVDAAGSLGEQGHEITYDANGNRTSDKFWGPKVAVVGGQPIITGYDEAGAAIYVTGPTDFQQDTGYTLEEYRYDALNRLQSVVKDGMQIDLRLYDGADRVVQSGPKGVLNAKYAAIINKDLTPDQINGKEKRINRYDANGRLLQQFVRTSDDHVKLMLSWDKSVATEYHGTYYTPGGYDNVGNALGYTLINYDAGLMNGYSTSLAKFDGYQGSVTSGKSTKLKSGNSTQAYDANGFLVSIDDSTQDNNDRTFVNDANGRALFVNQAGNVQRQLIVNGEVLGRFGVQVDPTNPASGYEKNPRFANIVDFDFGYAKVSASYPNPSPGAYTVRAGDTLQSIAQGAYGDSSLWFRIAEANGLATSSDMRVGQTLNIPNRVGTINNNATTFKPYDPSRIEGDKTPSLAMPKPKKDWLGQLVMIVVAIVVAYFTAGAYLGAFGTGMCTATGTVYTTGSLIAAGAVGGASGAVASQAVGVATGTIDEFDWKGVALSAIGGGVTAGVGTIGTLAGDGVGAVVARAVVSNAISQGIGVVAGLQEKFSWRGVAASAVGAGVGHAVGEALSGGTPTKIGANGEVVRVTTDPVFGYSIAGIFAHRVVSGLAAGTAVAVMRGGRIAIQQIASDAFGAALGSSLAEAATSDFTATMGAGPVPVSEGGGSLGGLKVSQSLYDSWGPKVNVPDALSDGPAWDLYAGGTPRPISLGAYGEQPYAPTYSEASADDGVPIYVDSETGAQITPVRPQAVLLGRALPPLAPIPRVAVEPSAGQYVVARVFEEIDGIRARLDALGEDPSTPTWLRFGAAMARGPGNWIPDTVKFLAGAGGYALDSQLRGQVNTAVGNFLSNDPIGTIRYAATRYWDDHSLLEVGADSFNLVAGGAISAPFGKLSALMFRGTVSAVSEAGEAALRWTQRLSDYSLEFPQMRTQALYSFAGAVDPRPLIPTIRNLRAEAMALAPEGFEVVRISNGSAIMRYADDTYYSVPKRQYSVIPELRTMDTMGDVFTRRAQSIADSFDSRVSLTLEQSARLDATPDGWLKNRFLSAYKGLYVHVGLKDELPFIPGAEGLAYKTVGPDIVSSSGGMGLKYEITRLTPSLNAIYSHTKKYPGELLRYVTYR